MSDTQARSLGVQVEGLSRVLVTGASAGIGEAYVRQLAPYCESMVMVARREDRLHALREALAGECNIECVVADLATLEGQSRVVECIRQGSPLELLVNNAGFSTLGPFADCTLDDELEMLRLHQEATLALSRAALPAMRKQGKGAIINVSSIGGLLEMPGVAVYGASKSFLVSFTRSLRAELGEEGVRVQCLCPGYTRTEIHSRDRFSGFDVNRVPAEMWMEADAVVKESLEALFAQGQGSTGAKTGDHWLVIPGRKNRQLVAHALQGLLDEVSAADSGGR